MSGTPDSGDDYNFDTQSKKRKSMKQVSQTFTETGNKKVIVINKSPLKRGNVGGHFLMR